MGFVEIALCIGVLFSQQGIGSNSVRDDRVETRLPAARSGVRGSIEPGAGESGGYCGVGDVESAVYTGL